MTDRELKQRIREAYAPPKSKRREEFLQQISCQEEEDEFWKAARLGRRNFFFSQLGYIRKRVWVLSVLLFIAAVFMSCAIPVSVQNGWYYVTEDGELVPDADNGATPFAPDYESLLWSMSAVLPLLGVILTAEEGRSFRYGMQEIEMAAKYNRMQIYLARMLFLGMGNLLWILAADVLLHWIGSGAADFVIVYLLVPYLLSMILSLEIGRICPRNSSGSYSVAAACAVSVGYICLNGTIDLYQKQYRLCWAVLCILLLYWSVKWFVKIKKTWEEQLCILQ